MKTHSLQRTMEYLRGLGYIVDKVEMPYNAFSHQRKDFLGFIDAIAISDTDTIAIQACSTGELPAHERKIRLSPNFEPWCKAGRSVLLVGWSKRVVRNKDGTKAKVKRWVPKSYYVYP